PRWRLAHPLGTPRLPRYGARAPVVRTVPVAVLPLPFPLPRLPLGPLVPPRPVPALTRPAPGP
ncbi:hypothetical protein B7767_16800, partial [Streptomyces sp. 13-12-16]